MQQFHLLNKTLRSIFTKLTHRACNSPRLLSFLTRRGRRVYRPLVGHRTDLAFLDALLDRGKGGRCEPAGWGVATEAQVPRNAGWGEVPRNTGWRTAAERALAFCRG